MWALQETKEQDMIDTDDDTALIFHSWTEHRKYLNHLKNTFENSGHENCLHAIAVKTNPHPAVLKQLVHWGFGLECASMEEVQLAVNAGCPGSKIVFDSPVKTKNEIRICNESMKLRGIIVNVNSLEELDRIPTNPNFVLGLRINPLVDTGTPEMFQVSGNESKFGTPISDKAQILDAIVKYPVTQLHVHSGTAMKDLSVAVSAITSVVNIATEANEYLRRNGIVDRQIVGVDIGGGLRPEILQDDHDTSPSRMEYYVSELKKSAPELWNNNMKLITEFGQWSYFYSGYVYSKIEYALQRGHTNVVYVHVGADMFMRDVYTGKNRGIDFVPIKKNSSTAADTCCFTDIAGPLCFAGDYLEQQIENFPKLEEDDELLLLNTGSNAFGLWSRHCSRTIPKVIGVDLDTNNVFQMSPRRNPHVANIHDDNDSSFGLPLLPWETTNDDDDDEEEDLVAAL